MKDPKAEVNQRLEYTYRMFRFDDDVLTISSFPLSQPLIMYVAGKTELAREISLWTLRRYSFD